MGHEIAPGASYCPHGHPIALEAMPFANDQYGGGYPQQAPGQGGFGGAPPAPGFGGQPQYGQPAPGGYPDPNAQFGGGYGQQQPGFGGAPPPPPPGQGGFGAPPQPGFGGDPGYGQQPGFGGAPPPPPPGQGGFGAPPQPGYGQAPGGFGAPAPGQDFGGGAPAPGGSAAPAPPPALAPNAVRGFIVTYQANPQGDFWPLAGGRKTVGRANSGEQVDIPLSDATISSRHAAFVVDAVAGTVQVEDTGSTNGTFVNEEHIGFNGKRDLRDGDKVRFGGFSTIVKIVGRI
jgi:FHA domain